MKNFKIFLVLFSISAILTAQSLGFSNLDKSPLDVVMYRDADQSAVARIIYSRPSKNDRIIFGDLVPYNQVWRTGANEATEVTFYKDVMIEDQKVFAGTYSIYTVPGEEEWTFILNSDTTQSGMDYTESHTVFKTAMDVFPAPQTIESFSINFSEELEGATLFMGWDDRIASVKFKVALP
ncbi:DUF2911 domain-containing protein [Nonlabens antarcticus]|uniref:DUF2911 domain-containing protein n=1 Tax=Nonlabens antarcticus TaxID=392714 RepID=UPI00189153BC|nr:DUF2911 domain-containing protein [Nonlabens antarcticus]